jgi:hypothetical protein
MPYILDSPDTSDSGDNPWGWARFDIGEPLAAGSTRDERFNWGLLRVSPLVEYEEDLSSVSSLRLEIGDLDDNMNYTDRGSLAAETLGLETPSPESWASGEDLLFERTSAALHRLPEIEALRNERSLTTLVLQAAEGQGQEPARQEVQGSPIIRGAEDEEMNRPLPIGDLTSQFRPNTNGYGAQCIHDPTNFSLWDEGGRQFRTTPGRQDFLCGFFNVEAFGYATYYMWVFTQSPPDPMPLTFAGRPVKFVGPGESCKDPIPNAGHYSNPRVEDPCSGVWWPRLSNPTCGDRRIIIDILQGFVNPRLIIYFPSYIVVELKPDADRPPYEAKALPGTIAGRTVLYHEPSSIPFVQVMGDPAHGIPEHDNGIHDDITRAVSAPPESTYPFFNRLENRWLAEYYHRISSATSASQGSWAIIQLKDLFPGQQPVSGVVAMMCIGCADKHRTTTSPSNYRHTTMDWQASNVYQIFGLCDSGSITGQMVRERMVGQRLSGSGGKSEQVVTLITGDFVFCTELKEFDSEGV